MPDITPAVRPSASAPQLEIIRKAVNAAHAAGLTVSTVPDLGVHCTSSHAPCWAVGERVSVVSPLGAVLLHLQPAIPDADAALAHALQANRLWVQGFDEGQAGERSNLIVNRGAAAALYNEGWKAGTEFRAIMHRREGVPIDRTGETPTRPVLPDTPRAILAELMSTLTVSQVLEALADSIPERGWDADETADCAIELRALAEDYARAER